MVEENNKTQLKALREYNEDKLIKIKGKGLSGNSIYQAYLSVVK